MEPENKFLLYDAQLGKVWQDHEDKKAAYKEAQLLASYIKRTVMVAEVFIQFEPQIEGVKQ